MDGFWFSIFPNVIVGPFDFVCVDNIYNSRTIGIVKELRTVSNIHDIKQNLDADMSYASDHPDSRSALIGKRAFQVHGTRIARVAVMTNVQNKNEEQDDRGKNSNVIIRMPVGINASVVSYYIPYTRN